MNINKFKILILLFVGYNLNAGNARLGFLRFKRVLQKSYFKVLERQKVLQAEMGILNRTDRAGSNGHELDRVSAKEHVAKLHLNQIEKDIKHIDKQLEELTITKKDNK